MNIYGLYVERVPYWERNFRMNDMGQENNILGGVGGGVWFLNFLLGALGSRDP
jgi:hypothetical protein